METHRKKRSCNWEGRGDRIAQVSPLTFNKIAGFAQLIEDQFSRRLPKIWHDFFGYGIFNAYSYFA